MFMILGLSFFAGHVLQTFILEQGQPAASLGAAVHIDDVAGGLLAKARLLELLVQRLQLRLELPLQDLALDLEGGRQHSVLGRPLLRAQVHRLGDLEGLQGTPEAVKQ